MNRFAIVIQGQMGKPVVDKTGLSGHYDFFLPLPELAEPLLPGEPLAKLTDRIADLLPRKLEEQLGLKLEPGKVTVETLVIEHVERPAEN